MRAEHLRDQVGGIPADPRHGARTLEAEAVGALDCQRHLGAAHVIERKGPVEQPDEWADRSRRIVVLGPPQQQRRAALDVAQVDVIAERRTHDLAARIGDDDDFRLRVVPARRRQHTDRGAGADSRHGRRLGEDLGVRPDADLEILRPQALGLQHALEVLRLRRSGHQPVDCATERGLDLGAHCDRGFRLAARLLLDQSFEQRLREGDARRLDRLQVDRRDEPRPCEIAAALDTVCKDVADAADPLASGAGRCGGRLRGLAQVAHGREGARDVLDAAGTDTDDRRPLHIRPPYAPDQSAGGAVRRKRILGRQIDTHRALIASST
jgi:hypothetical protein